MTHHPEADLQSLKQDVARKATLLQRLTAVRATLTAEQARRKRLAERMRSEKADLDALEGLSLGAFLAALTGSRAERTEKERSEYLAAKLTYDNWAAGMAALNEQESALHAELASLRDAEARYEAALAAREAALVSAGGGTAARLWAVSGELGTARAAARELDEAANAAAAAGKALDELVRTLDEAEELGQWDLANSDSYYATARKHERLGEARAAAGYAHQKLQRLRTELADMDVRVDRLEVQVEGGLEQADYFMDGIFVDWIVQRRIHQAQERAAVTRNRVRTLTVELRARATNRQARVAELERERRALLEPE